MFSPHWIPVPDIICLIHLFPARMPYSWQCGADPSGGQQEGGGRQAGWGRWKEGAKNEGSVGRDAFSTAKVLTGRGEGQELPYAQTSLLTERNFLGARGERAEWLQCRNPMSWVKTVSGSKDLANKDTADKERMIDEPFLYPFCLNLLTWGFLCVDKMIILVYFPLKSGLWVQKPFPGHLTTWSSLPLQTGRAPPQRSGQPQVPTHFHIPPYFPTISKTHSRGCIIFPGLFF